MTDPLLSLLSSTDYISGEKLCAALGMTRGAVWKRMEKLRAQGYQILSGGKRGYRLEPAPNSLLPGYLEKELDTQWAGRGVLVYAQEMTSTNAVLKEMGRDGAPRGSLALCEMQSAGRGRLQRSWITPPGEALTQSLLLRPSLSVEQAQLCTLAAAVAAVKAISDLCPALTPSIKWPNDVVINGKKCVGILSELSADMDGIQYVVMGVGINVNQTGFAQELGEKATSLLLEARKQTPNVQLLCRRTLLCAYLRHMENAMECLEREGMAGLLPTYLPLSATIGARVQVLGNGIEFTGLAEKLDETGALLVRQKNGSLRRVLSGDVSVRGLMGYV